MGKGQVYLGIVFMFAGAGILSLFNIAGAIYGVILFLMGMFLIIYRNADNEIEQIKEKEVKKK
jgi:hypothetical protein